MRQRFFCVLAGLVTCVAIAGCGEQALEGVVPVSGTVTYQGQPVEGANVIFTPVAEGRAASGVTDSRGRYTLTTLQPGDGAEPGSYRVMIQKTETEGGLTEEEAQAYFEQHGTPPPTGETRHLLPAKYARPDTSELTAEVREGENNVFDFALAD